MTGERFRMTGPLGLFGVVTVVFFVAVIDVSDALPPQRIVGGTKAAPGEFPYMVSLRYRGEHGCGGVIIGPRHILTVAHCYTGFKRYMYFRISAATGSVLITGDEVYSARTVVIHPDYETVRTNPSIDSRHDIAIVVLRKDIAFNENQTSIALPTKPVPEGVLATFTGWGFKSSRDNAEISSELMKMSVRTLRADSCTGRYNGFINITTSNICSIGGTGIGICTHDSGGPLVYNGQVHGLAVWAISCGWGFPDVYTSVYHHVDWIKRTMEQTSPRP